MNKNRILILTQTNPQTDFMFKNWILNGLKADIIFRNVSKPFRLIRRIWMNIPLPFFQIWLGEWKKELKNYDIIIFHANDWSRHIPKYIHSINKNARIIYWYWNPVTRLSDPSKVDDSMTELWTFDKNDAKKYGMKYTIQYYSQFNLKNTQKESFSKDVYFIGHDKGRKEKIEKLANKLKSLGVKVKIQIIESGSKFVPYNEVCQEIYTSKAILELTQKGQTGYTLRALESLFFSRKLITDNKNILNEPFYNPNNIFVIGVNDISEIKNFIEIPYDKHADVFKKQYDVKAWLNNFMNEGK